MTDVPQENLNSDRIRIDAEALSNLTFEVRQTKVEDLGITKVVVMTLTAPADTFDGEASYILKWALHSDTVEVVKLDSMPEGTKTPTTTESYEVSLNDIISVE